MATLTTEQATKYFRDRLSDPRNPMPWLIIEQAHKTQNFTEIETRLQGKFGFHDHGPSLRLIARYAVCDLVLERGKLRAEQIENYKGWERRRVAACKRINAGLYGYCDPQAEDDGISLAAIDTEMGQLMNEYNLTDEEVTAIECEITPEDRRNGRARVVLERHALNVIQPDPARQTAREKAGQASTLLSYAERLLGVFDHNRPDVEALRYLDEIAKHVESLRAIVAPKPVEVAVWVADVKPGDILNGSPVVEVAEWVDDGGKVRHRGRKITCEAGGVYWYYDHNELLITRPASTLTISTCEKCRKETTEKLIPVDREDFDARAWDVEGFPLRAGVQVFRHICGACCRGSR